MLFTLEDYYIGESEIPVTVKFEYTPEERAVYYPSDYAYPGCAAEVNIYEVMQGAEDIVDYLTVDQYNEMEEACFEEVDDRYGRLECMEEDKADGEREESKLNRR